MAIDDLNTGLISEDEAKERRKMVARIDFYGAMDGASKFIRFDYSGQYHWWYSDRSCDEWYGLC